MVKKNDKDKIKTHWFNYNTMATRNNKTKKVSPYICPTGTEIIGLMIKSQNEILLRQIAKDKNMSQDATEDMLKLFIKPCYFLPQVTADKNKENIQKKYIQ